MKCIKCNYELPQGALFCSQCGIEVNKTEKIIKISLQCKMCGGELIANSDEGAILICPYCGTKELIMESDVVKIEKMRNAVNKEIEMEKMKYVEKQQSVIQEREMKRETQKLAEEFKESKLGKFLIVAFVMSLLFIYLYFTFNFIWAGLLTVIQAGCFSIAWLMGMQIIKEKRDYTHIILVLIGILLIIPTLKCIIYL